MQEGYPVLYCKQLNVTWPENMAPQLGLQYGTIWGGYQGGDYTDYWTTQITVLCDVTPYSMQNGGPTYISEEPASFIFGVEKYASTSKMETTDRSKMLAGLSTRLHRDTVLMQYSSVCN